MRINFRKLFSELTDLNGLWGWHDVDMTISLLPGKRGSRTKSLGKTSKVSNVNVRRDHWLPDVRGWGIVKFMAVTMEDVNFVAIAMGDLNFVSMAMGDLNFVAMTMGDLNFVAMTMGDVNFSRFS